ncbi:MAG: hypothetical protein KAU91_00760, partial [Candidatus Aminicenantes bacterium]|nr:hypothetical protein [Candidatus Aminicenantes bacterium]
EEMALAETDRLLGSLKNLKIPCHYMIINMIVPATSCSFCNLKMKEQQRYIQEVKRNRYSDYCISEVPLFPHKINGIDELRELSSVLYGR